MAVELGVHKIRVNSIPPGLFRFKIAEVLMQKEWLNKVALKITPLRTHGTSDPAVTSLIRYLVHDSSQYVYGTYSSLMHGLHYQAVSVLLILMPELTGTLFLLSKTLQISSKLTR
ncbi:hypothetical protein QYF36_001281 [Acer negundo]|nr:hypothetical protein QYF36_001281 [Acer negundo]